MESNKTNKENGIGKKKGERKMNLDREIEEENQKMDTNEGTFNLEENEKERRYNYLDRYCTLVHKNYKNAYVDKGEKCDADKVNSINEHKKQENEYKYKNAHMHLSKTIRDDINIEDVGADADDDFDKTHGDSSLSNPYTEESFNSHIFKINHLRKIYSNSLSYYYALNAFPLTSPKIIKKNYMLLVKLLRVHTLSPADKDECYHLFQNAYKTLSDKFERFYYNILHDHCYSEAEAERQRAILEKEADAIYEYKKKELMGVYLQKVKEEEEKNGLIIEKALYGNLILKDKYLKEYLKIEEIKEEHLEGPYYDLTVFLQSKVENSNLFFNKESSFAYFCGIPKPLIKIGPREISKPAIKYDYINMTSKNALDGYDKNMFRTEHKLKYAYDLEDMELHVYIKYKFLNKYHEVTISDRTGFTLPRNSHRIVGNHLCGPFSPANVIQMKKISSNTFDTIINFFSKHKIHITLFTTLLLCAQLLKTL